MKLTKDAIKLLRKVKKHILAEPRRLDMQYFSNRKEKQIAREPRPDKWFPPCNTTACIAGWCVLLHDGMEHRSDDPNELEERAHILLSGHRWTKPVHDLFYTFHEGSRKEVATTMAAHVDAFIEAHK